MATTMRTVVKSTMLAVILLVAGAVSAFAQVGPGSDGFQPIVSRLSGQCLTAVNASAGLRQQPCQGTPDQLWRLLPVNGTRYFWLIDKQSGKCLEAALPSAEVLQTNCGVGVSQRWFLAPDGGSSYKITNIAARATEPNTLEVAGSVVRQGQWQGGRQQQWAVTAAAPQPPTKAAFRTEDRGTYWVGEYTIANPDLVPLPDWVLEFDLPAGAWMGHYWNGTPTVSGTHVTVRPTPTNRTIPAAGSTVFGFTGLGALRNPTNCKINGLPCAGPMQVLPPPNIHNVTATQLQIYWLHFAEPVVRYEVERDGTVIASIPGMFFSDTGVRPGGTYAYRVRAVVQDGRVSAFSPAITVTTPSA